MRAGICLIWALTTVKSRAICRFYWPPAPFVHGGVFANRLFEVPPAITGAKTEAMAA